MTHQCKETKSAKRKKSWCSCPKENTPSIQILPRLEKPNEDLTVNTKHLEKEKISVKTASVAKGGI